MSLPAYTMCRYLNKEGKETTFQIGPSLDRLMMDDKFHSLVNDAGMAPVYQKCMPLLQHLEKLYRANAIDFLVYRHKWPMDMAKLAMKAMKVETATVMVDDMRIMSVHRDPGTPIPAAVFGPGTACQTENGKWVEQCKGGRLFLLNGLIDISYSPLDGTFLDGCEPHGPTSLKPLKEEAAKKNRKPLKRFSVVMFCRYQKGNGENYGNYNGTWKEEWRADIEAIAGVDGGRVLRSHKKDGVTQKISHGYGTRSNKRQKKSETGICPLAITCV